MINTQTLVNPSYLSPYSDKYWKMVFAPLPITGHIKYTAKKTEKIIENPIYHAITE